MAAVAQQGVGTQVCCGLHIWIYFELLHVPTPTSSLFRLFEWYSPLLEQLLPFPPPGGRLARQYYTLSKDAGIASPLALDLWQTPCSRKHQLHEHELPVRMQQSSVWSSAEVRGLVLQYPVITARNTPHLCHFSCN